jgi:spore coat protein U-like protein
MKKNQISLISGFTLLATLTAVFPSFAAPSSTSCSIQASSVAFGAYNVFNSSPTDSTGTITYNCGASINGNITIELSKGQASAYPRQMANGSERLNYNLFRDASRLLIWGTASDSYSLGNPPKNQDVTVTIYGRIPALQDVKAGSYSDTISATINF